MEELEKIQNEIKIAQEKLSETSTAINREKIILEETEKEKGQKEK